MRARVWPLALALVAVLTAAASGLELRTNLSRALVPLGEIRPGGPPPDGIPPIDRPQFVRPTAADAWLKPTEPVLSLEINRE